MTAGLYAARARMKSLLIEKGFSGGQVMTTEWIENYPGFEEGISGAELAGKMEAQALRFGLEITQGSVIGVVSEGKYKKVRLDDDSELETKAVILATGSNPRPLNIKGEDEYRGRGVSYCATCDGAFYKDDVLVVVGGGDSAVEEGLFLTKFASKVYIVHRRDQLRAAKVVQERAFANPKIEFIWDSAVREIKGDESGVETIDLENLKTGEHSTIQAKGIFIYIGYDPNTEFIKELVTLNESNYIVAEEDMSTSTPGVFVAGDVRSKPLKQIATAVGDGAIAAITAEKYVEETF